MNDTTHEIDWRNTLPEELEGHRCIAVTKTGETLEGVLEYRTAQPDMYVRIDSLHLPGVKEWVIVNQCESGNEMGEGFVSVKVFGGAAA